MKKITITLLWVLASSISFDLLACECAKTKSVEAEVKNSDAVFVGTVLSKQLQSSADDSMIKYSLVHYNLLVQSVYKGKITADTISVYSGVGHGDCGFMFEIGKKYIVYGYKKSHFVNDNELSKQPSSFWTNSCLRTTLFNQSEIDSITLYTSLKE